MAAMGVPNEDEVFSLRVVVRSANVDDFIKKYSRFVKDDRIFIFTKTPKDPGTPIRFALELSGGIPLLLGEGTVTRVRKDVSDPKHQPGMEIKFTPLDHASAQLIEKMIASRGGMPSEISSVTDAKTVKRPRPMGPPKAGASNDSGPTQLRPPRMDEPTTKLDQATTTEYEKIGDDKALKFLEAWRAEDPDGTVPANPFANMTDESIEYFVEWSVEKSQDPSQASVVPPSPEATTRQVEVPARPLLSPAPTEPTPTPAPVRPAPPPAAAIVPPPPPQPRPAAASRSVFGIPMLVAFFLGGVTGAGAMWAFGQDHSFVKIDEGEAMRILAQANDAPRHRATKATKTTTPSTATATTTPANPPAASPTTPAPTTAAPTTTPANPPAPSPTTAPIPAGTLVALSVRTNPPDAQLSIDGVASGKTPQTLKVTLGEHEIKITRPRYADAVERVSAPGNVEIVLKRPTAVVHVTSTPSGQEVTVKGAARGKTPVDVELSAFQQHEIVVGGTWKKKVTVRPPEVSVHADLN